MAKLTMRHVTIYPSDIQPFSYEQNKQIKALDRVLGMPSFDMIEHYPTVAYRIRMAKGAWRYATDPHFRMDVESVGSLEELPYIFAELKDEIRKLRSWITPG